MLDDAIAYYLPDAVRVSGGTRTALYNAMRDGRLRFRKMGRRTIIMRDDLMAYLEALPVGRRHSDASHNDRAA